MGPDMLRADGSDQRQRHRDKSGNPSTPGAVRQARPRPLGHPVTALRGSLGGRFHRDRLSPIWHAGSVTFGVSFWRNTATKRGGTAPSRPILYRERAEQLRLKAASLAPLAKAELLILAERYERLAEEMEPWGRDYLAAEAQGPFADKKEGDREA